jgi:hypothetical protein
MIDKCSFTSLYNSIKNPPLTLSVTGKQKQYVQDYTVMPSQPNASRAAHRPCGGAWPRAGRTSTTRRARDGGGRGVAATARDTRRLDSSFAGREEGRRGGAAGASRPIKIIEWFRKTDLTFFRRGVRLAMPPVWSNPLSGPAQSYQSINQVELADDFYKRNKSNTIKALTHASLVLKRMSEKEFHSCEDAFFLSMRNGLILVVKQLTKFVEAVLHAFTKGVHDSEDRLRKAGFASFATLKDSTKLNVTQRVLNKHTTTQTTYMMGQMFALYLSS